MLNKQKVCKQCNKELEAIPYKKDRKFCSSSCVTTYRNLHNNPMKKQEAIEKVRQKKLGKSNYKIMGNNNPMKRSEVRFKVGNTLREKYHNSLSEKALKQWKEGNLKPHLMSEENRKNQIKRMIENNPMKHSEVRNKVKKAWILKINNGFKSPNRNRERPDFSEYLKIHNPMKNPELSLKVLKKSRETLLKNNNISKGQQLLYDYLTELKIVFEKEYQIGRYFLDSAILDKKIAIEYDGYQSHIYNYEDDKKRDLFLGKEGWKTLRIKRREIYNKDFVVNKIIDFLNEEKIKMVINQC